MTRSRGSRAPAVDRPADDPDVGGALVALTGSDGDTDRGAARSALTTLARGAKQAGVRGVAGGQWLTDTLADTAPRLPVRSGRTLRAQHPGLDTEQIADRLVGAAVNAATVVGVAGGALAAVQWASPPTLLTTPAQLAAETLAIAAVEVKLVAELHELYGVPAPGSVADRGLAYLAAWARRRGIDPRDPGSMVSGLGVALRRQIRKRLLGRFGRNLTTMGPLLTGAAIGGAANRHATRELATAVRADVRIVAAGSRR